MKNKILIVEHNLTDFELIQDELKKGCVNYIAKMVQTKNEYETALHDFKPDLILSNYILPSFEGISAFELKQKLAPQTPLIFVSNAIDVESAIKLIKSGVNDLVFKENFSTLTDKVNCALQEAKKTVLNQLNENYTKELWQNEAKFKALFENSIDGILLTVTDGQILAANPAACEIFQRTEQEIIDAGRFGIIDNNGPGLKPMIKERLRTGSITGEMSLLYKDGSTFSGELTSAVYKDSNRNERTSMIMRDITERKQATEKINNTTNSLQQALIDLTKILDFSLDLICSYDEEGRIVRVNAASESILGYKPEELMGEKYIDFIFHDDADDAINADINIKSGMQLTMFENRFIHKNGSIVSLLWSAVWDDECKLSYCIGKDTTKKKNLEKAFEIERQRFHDLYSQAPSCMGILKGPNHVFELANELYLQLIDKKDVIGKTVKEVLPELKSQGIFTFLDTVYQTGKTFSANEMLVKFDYHGNGKLVDTYLNFIYQAHRDMDNNIDGILFFANDVTEQVLSRKKIEESIHRYNSLIEQAGDAICFINASMQIIEVNHYACEKLGYSKSEISQLSIADFFLEEDLKVNPMQMVALKKGKTVRNERRIKRKNDTLIDVELSAKMMNDGSFLIFLRDITEHKKAQQALIESEKKYRQIVETAQEGIWIIDKNHKTTFVNNKMCEILEYTQKEMIGKEIYSFMDEEGHQIAAKLIKRKKEDKSDKREFKYISKSGKEVWANVAANPYISETGEYKGSIAMVDDITEIKKTQQTLKESEKKYRLLFENNPMPMWVLDSNTFRFLDVNEMAVLQYGYSREEFLSMTALDIRPKEDKERFRQANKSFESKSNGAIISKEIWNHRKKDGTIIVVEIFGQEIIFEESSARLILSSDISQRKIAEKSLLQSESRLKEAQAIARLGSWELNFETGIALWSDETCRIYGLSPKDNKQSHSSWISFIHPDDMDNVMTIINESQRTLSNSVLNNRIVLKNGVIKHIDSECRFEFDQNGKPVGLFGIVHDVTEIKLAKLQLERQNIELAFQNSEKENRTKELTITNNELIKTNVELDRFVYSVSHDLRSPLTSILGLISFIEEESKEVDTLEHVKMIRNSVNRLDEFIKNILSYSRNNRTGLEIEKIPLQKTTTDIVNSLQSMKEAKGIHFEIDIREQNPFYSDSLRFKTILENLISNAIKHHKKDISSRYIKITVQSDPEKLELTISDNGIGIAPAHHQKIFDMFFRLSGKTDGSGIGLYIVKDTVEILQGSIEIQSEKGIGTSFIITLKNLKP